MRSAILVSSLCIFQLTLINTAPLSYEEVKRSRSPKFFEATCSPQIEDDVVKISRIGANHPVCPFTVRRTFFKDSVPSYFDEIICLDASCAGCGNGVGECVQLKTVLQVNQMNGKEWKTTERDVRTGCVCRIDQDRPSLASVPRRS